MQIGINRLLALAVTAIVGCATVASGPVSESALPGTTWKWIYRTYDSLSKDEMPAGVFRLVRTSSGFEARIDIQNPGECYRGGMAPAKVETGATTTTIYVPALMPGCGDRRYTVAKDGSGGVMAIRTGETMQRNGVVAPATAWVDDVTPRGLTAIR